MPADFGDSVALGLRFGRATHNNASDVNPVPRLAKVKIGKLRAVCWKCRFS